MMKIKRRITKTYFDLACHQYAPLIHQLATRISRNETQMEEMKAGAKEELLKCLICYDGSSSFMTFLYSRLEGAFRHMVDVERRASRIKPMSHDSMSQITGPNYDMDFTFMIQECLECLNKDEKDIISGLFFDEKTMRQISDDMGIVPSTICRIKTRAIKKMRQKCQVGVE